MFEATGSVLPAPLERMIDPIPTDFNLDEILEADSLDEPEPDPVQLAAAQMAVEQARLAKQRAEDERAAQAAVVASLTEQAPVPETPRPQAPRAVVVEAVAANVDAVVAPLSRRIASLAIDLLPVAGALMLILLALEGRLEKGGAPLMPTTMHGLGRMYWSLGAMVWLVLSVLVVVPLVYHTLSLHYMGGSVGDLLFGIRWITKSGSRPSIVRSLVRALVAIPSWTLALTGVLLALLTRSRRTFYDIVTGCYPVLK